MYVFTYMRTYEFTFLHICAHTCFHACTRVRACLYTFTGVSDLLECVSMHTCTQRQTYSCIHICLHKRMDDCIDEAKELSTNL